MDNAALLKYFDNKQVCDELTQIPASSLLVHFGLYQNIINENILNYSSVFKSMQNKTAKHWIDENISSLYNQQIIQEILNLYVSKTLNSNTKLLALIASSKQFELLFNELFFEIQKEMFTENDKDVAEILSLNDISIRLGQYSHSSNLIERIITKYPTNLYSGFINSCSAVKSQKIISTLWNSLKTSNKHDESLLIWRSKSISSSLNTVLKTKLFDGITRHEINKFEAIEACDKLLSDINYSDEECIFLYNKLVYDHLAATIILDNPSQDYEELISTLPLPKNYKIIKADFLPRLSYHHRLWTLIQIDGGFDQAFTFELMIKNKLDFDIGRAYQWKEKNCYLALSSSPWKLDGSFNRDLAITKMQNFNSINSLLISEIEEWHKKKTI